MTNEAWNFAVLVQSWIAVSTVFICSSHTIGMGAFPSNVQSQGYCGRGFICCKTLIYWWNWYVFLMHQDCTWQKMWSKKDFLPKGMLVNVELLSLLLSGVFCFLFCSLVGMILTSSLLLWRPTTKASPTIASCDTWLWFWLLVFDCEPLDCYEVLGSSVVCEAQKDVYCLSSLSISSIIASSHCIWRLLNNIDSFSFIYWLLAISASISLCPAAQLEMGNFGGLILQSSFNGHDPSHSLAHTWKASPASTEGLAYYSNSSTLLHKKPANPFIKA